MCLAIPGRIIHIGDGDPLSRKGKLEFGGVIKEVSLAYVPEAKIDDYAIVHAGFAISLVDEKEAQETLKCFKEMEDEQ